MSTPDVPAEAERLRGYVTALRRRLHADPERSFAEVRTGALLADELRAAGLTPSRPAGTSVVAELDTGRPGPALALRADMDALPVHEETGLAFASRTAGLMHACGHDGHMAILAGVARALGPLRDALRGRIRLVFQHAEEPLPSGAPELIERGVLDGVHAIAGLHLWTPLDTGLVAAPAGPLMASTDYFDITVTGRGGHAGLPHEVIDPIVPGAQLVTGLQRVAAAADPAEPLVVAVTAFTAGDHNAVVPETATLRGTVRALREEPRRRAAERITEIAHGVAAAYGARAEVTYRFGPPAVRNEDRLAAAVQECLRPGFGDRLRTTAVPVMAGEDFAWYQRQVPGVFLLVGAGAPGRPRFPHHHPRFDLDEDALVVGVEALLSVVLGLCGRDAPPWTRGGVGPGEEGV